MKRYFGGSGFGRPGSEAAREQGCVCPVIDNHHGLGRRGDGDQHGWLVIESCRVHGPTRSAIEELDRVLGEK